ALTAHPMANDRAKGLNAGCTEYLTKPIEKGTLLRVVAAHLPASAVVEGPPAGPAGTDRPAAGPVRSTMAADADMKDVLAEFVGRLPTQVNRLAGLLRAADLDELRRAAHQLKGAGGGYG